MNLFRSVSITASIVVARRGIALRCWAFQAPEIRTFHRLSSSMSAANTASSDATSAPSSSDRIRVLALHGSEGSAASFTKILAPWTADYSWEVRAVDHAPVVKGGGRAWWSMPPYARSFNATEYTHFDESERLVLEEIQDYHPDLILGHSQGAILVTALLARGKIAQHPPLGYILNGGAWPNPYTNELNSLQFTRTPKFLIIAGERDKVTPNEQSTLVGDALQKAGGRVTQLRHPAGHAVPIGDVQVTESIQQWLEP